MMKKQFRYGFTWVSLLGTFLFLAVVALAALWQAGTLDTPVHIFGFEIAPASASLVVLVIGAFFAVSAGIIVSLMFQQRGMSPFIIIDQKSLILPVAGTGEVKIPLAEMTGWQVSEKTTRKTLRIEHAGRCYNIESRLMASYADFDELAAALRAGNASKEQVAGGKPGVNPPAGGG